MNDIISVIRKLPQLAYVKGASMDEISAAEKKLGLLFSREYREYIAEFGSIEAESIELTGIIDADYCNVVSVTKREWELNPKIPHNMYVIENTCMDGIMIWQDTAGTVYQSEPFSEPKQIAASLTEYIMNRTR